MSGAVRRRRVLATPAAMQALYARQASPMALLSRHLSGDWGEVSPDDAQLNEAALVDGGRLMSSFRVGDDLVVWVITEAVGDDGVRAATTLLLPEDY